MNSVTNNKTKLKILSWNNRKILKKLQHKKIDSLLFYTNSENLLFILEKGIQLLKNIELQKGSKYIVWSFSQHKTQTHLEFEISSRREFWNWALAQNINPNNVGVISINLIELFNTSKSKWIYDESKNNLIISENISSFAFMWIMVQQKNIYNDLLIYQKIHLPNLSIFYSNSIKVKR